MMASRFEYRGSAVPDLFVVMRLSWVAASRYPPPAGKLTDSPVMRRWTQTVR